MAKVISSIYNRQPRKTAVNYRRINREIMRHKLAVASFVDVPRLITAKFNNPPKMVQQ